jgi:geranylgeranyl pyrophosphate synthase
LIHAAIVSPCLLREDIDDGTVAALDAFGRAIGVAFQIKDDILDVEGETHVIGKPSGSDARLGKATYPGLFGLDASHRRCDELLHSAVDNLKSIGQSTAPLEWLARYIVERGQ